MMEIRRTKMPVLIQTVVIFNSTETLYNIKKGYAKIQQTYKTHSATFEKTLTRRLWGSTSAVPKRPIRKESKSIDAPP